MWLYQDWLDIHLNRNFAENCKYFFRFYSFLFHNRLSLELSPKIWANVEQTYCFVQKLITFTENAGLNAHIISSLGR